MTRPSITSGLHRAVALWPDKTAYVCADRAVSWSEFRNRVACGAAVLRDLGLKRGDRLAVLSDNTAAFYEVFMTAPWADVILVGLNTRWSMDEIAAALDDADADVVMVDARFASKAEILRTRRPTLRHVIYADTAPAPKNCIDWEAALSAADPAPDAHRSGDDIAYLIYTSGTTGQLKAAMLTMTSVVLATLMILHEFDYHQGVRFLCCAPLFHTAGSANVLAQVTQGSTLTLLPRFDAAAVVQAIARDRITHIQLVPTMIQMVLDLPEIAQYDLSSVTKIFYGAAPMPPALIARAAARLPGVTFHQGYALTESASVGTSLRPEDHSDLNRIGSVGRAVPGVEIAITDSEGRSLASGQIGEVRIRSAALMTGYWRKPEQTRAAFDGGWLRTGDGGRLDKDGYLTLVDRLKDMIISGGENIYSVEIENVIYAQPEVLECAAIGIPDPLWGEVVAVVVRLHPGSTLGTEDLIAAARQSLAGYKTPRRVFFSADPLPRNGSGKIVKTELKKRYGSL